MYSEQKKKKFTAQRNKKRKSYSSPGCDVIKFSATVT